jgi:hypothetical protein
MADAPYLIALALLEQGEGRALPLQGKSLREPLVPEADPGAVGHQLALDLLMRVWQRSDQGPLQRAAADQSLLLITVPIETLQEQLPALKAAWLNTGDTAALLQGLRQIASGVWSLVLEPRQPITYQRLG